MAISYVGGNITNAGGADSGVFTLPGAAQAGDFAICSRFDNSGASITRPVSGFTEDTYDTTNGHWWVGHRIVQAGDSTYAYAGSHFYGGLSLPLKAAVAAPVGSVLTPPSVRGLR